MHRLHDAEVLQSLREVLGFRRAASHANHAAVTEKVAGRILAADKKVIAGLGRRFSFSSALALASLASGATFPGTRTGGNEHRRKVLLVSPASPLVDDTEDDLALLSAGLGEVEFEGVLEAVDEVQLPD